MNIGEKMIDAEKFLDLVENHHIKGTLHNKECTNFCLVGATYVATDLFDFERGDVKDGASDAICQTKLYKSLEKAVKEFHGSYIEIATFNDSMNTSHEDIVAVAKKAVANLELEA